VSEFLRVKDHELRVFSAAATRRVFVEFVSPYGCASIYNPSAIMKSNHV
jgi:hypothetical protein